MLTDEAILAATQSRATYDKGCLLVRSGMMEPVRYTVDRNKFTTGLMGASPFRVEVTLDRFDGIDHYSCTCPDIESAPGACEHVVAAMKAIQSVWFRIEELRRRTKIPMTIELRSMLDHFANESLEMKSEAEPSRAEASIVPTLFIAGSGDSRLFWLELTIGSDRQYVMRKVPSFMESLFSGFPITFGKFFVFYPEHSLAQQKVNTVFDERSRRIVMLMRRTWIDEKRLNRGTMYSYHSSAFSEDRRFMLSNSNLQQFLDIMGDAPFACSINGSLMPELRIREGRPRFEMHAEAIRDGMCLRFVEKGIPGFALDEDYLYFYWRRAIYRLEPHFIEQVKPLMRCFEESSSSEIRIPETEISTFLTTVAPGMEKFAALTVDEALMSNYFHEELETSVWFDRHANGISARVEFRYGEHVLNPQNIESNRPVEMDGRRLLRKSHEEKRLTDLLFQSGFRSEGTLFVLDDEERLYSFLRSGLDLLQEQAEVFYSDEFKKAGIRSGRVMTAGVRFNENSGLLEMTIDLDEMDIDELMALLSSYRLKKTYHRLAGGSFMPLDDSGMRSAAELIDQLGLNRSDLVKKVIEIPASRAMYIDSVARESIGMHMDRNAAFRKLVRDINEPDDSEFEIPHAVTATLREYQKTGCRWLHTLADYRFGGILADDMGLGKTLQVLTLVQAEKHRGKPSLVIAPTSLLYNWQEEASKFTPELRVLLMTGTQTERSERFADVEQADLVVTSFGLIRRDVERYRGVSFRFCFVDEAQHIKNASSLNAKAVKQIRAESRFALTGTPVENSLTELWSIFDFVMPGYLHAHGHFVKRFETPIVKNGDRDALKELGRHIAPFLMRRMKKDVLKELPEKIESRMVSDMTEEQRKLYAAHLLLAKQEFEKQLAVSGFDSSRIVILALLTRLRQLCCHPGLFVEDYQGGSGKMDMLLELLADAIDAGHRVLVFSQFTGMLALIRKELELAGHEYHYLDGAVPAEERMRLVRSFNEGSKALFLISLKAGGAGLNLTGADMVVHVDPWWNPAVEDQATDRAYRIGQQKAVQVVRLITKDTIEDKIHALQERKKALIDSVIRPGENLLTRMTVDEVRSLFA